LGIKPKLVKNLILFFALTLTSFARADWGQVIRRSAAIFNARLEYNRARQNLSMTNGSCDANLTQNSVVNFTPSSSIDPLMKFNVGEIFPVTIDPTDNSFDTSPLLKVLGTFETATPASSGSRLDRVPSFGLRKFEDRMKGLEIDNHELSDAEAEQYARLVYLSLAHMPKPGNVLAESPEMTVGVHLWENPGLTLHQQNLLVSALLAGGQLDEIFYRLGYLEHVLRLWHGGQNPEEAQKLFGIDVFARVGSFVQNRSDSQSMLR
jgi:hypothetical protein